MKIEIAIKKPTEGRFSEIILGYQDKKGNKIEALLNIDYENIYKFTRKKTGISFDLFLISCFVYGIDIFIPRDNYSFNGWAREIESVFPVEYSDVFNKYKKELNHLLSFLTGDIWNVSFKKRNVTSLYENKKSLKVCPPLYNNLFEKVSLFSGGMDSLIGVIDELSVLKGNIVLASHYDAIFKGPKSDQDKIEEKLKIKYPNKYHLIQTRVDLSTENINIETTLRSRSFLFLCHSVLIAESLGNSIEILIPENGTIALNHPLTPSRRSSCSTRTAHPYYLLKLSEYISKLRINHNIRNKYELKTKGEMVEECKDRNLLLSIYKDSCSCAKRGTRKDVWDTPNGTHHCGTCMPCIYRRVALNKIGIDNEIVGTDLFNPQKRTFKKLPEIPSFFDYLETKLTLDDIEKNLLVNGSLPLEKITEYAKVVYRTREEIYAWIKQKGNDEIKNRLGIK
ncbi:hypothetical protein FACS189461_2570 [Spirochaetia bacterium]|nr:hypothetical protein FACS189461_2570 [Spirochaetia bacterium]